ncbi:MAG: hypothetical protein IT425_08940 [Pirellulales bacterium]|nr:hypothetical protein [Pirellulales bacterium]
MFNNCLAGRVRFVATACLVCACAANANAAHIPGMSQLGGWVYVDRNNDGHLAFVGEPNPEYVIGGVTVSLYKKIGFIESFVNSIVTDPFGRYLFENIIPGTYVLRETQPVEFVDGLDTLGALSGLLGQPVPIGASPGVASNNAFSDIVLTADVGGEGYNFGERGYAIGYASKRQLLTTSQPPNTSVPEPALIFVALSIACGGMMARRQR